MARRCFLFKHCAAAEGWCRALVAEHRPRRAAGWTHDSSRQPRARDREICGERCGICAEDVGDRGVALDLEKLRVKYGIGRGRACAGRVVVVFLFVVVEQRASDAAPAAAADFEALDQLF